MSYYVKILKFEFYIYYNKKETINIKSYYSIKDKGA